VSDKDTRDPAWLPLLLDMGRNEFYANQQIIPIFNDGTWKAVAEYVSALRARLAAAERVVEAVDQMRRGRDQWRPALDILDAEERVFKAALDYRTSIATLTTPENT